MVACVLECLVIFYFELMFCEMEFYLLLIFKALFKVLSSREDLLLRLPGAYRHCHWEHYKLNFWLQIVGTHRSLNSNSKLG